MDLKLIEEKLNENNQSHLLKYYDELSAEQKDIILSQINEIDFNLLKMLDKKGENEKGKLAPLGALEISDIEKNKDEYVSAGLEALKNEKVGAVLLAGGQGTRLGSDKPKGMVDIGVRKTLYIFEALINNMLDVVKMSGAYIPLYIMTSEKNNDDTVKFFNEHNFFGYDKTYVKFFKQEMAPSVSFDGKIYMEDKFKLSLSPNGNGGWFSSLVKAGLLDDINARKIEWLNVFSVDNVLQRIADPSFVGATILTNSVCSGKVVRKNSPNERVGVLCLEDDKPSIVEYYEMTDEMIHSKDENGNLLYNFGVTLNYLFRLDKLCDIMNKNMPVHIVEKKIPYINENGEYIKPEEPNGYKFETLVLDMIKLMDNCLPYEVERKYEFAPIKNKEGNDSIATARELLKLNGVEF